MRALDTQKGILGYDSCEQAPWTKTKPTLHITHKELDQLDIAFDGDFTVMELIRVYRLVSEGKI